MYRSKHHGKNRVTSWSAAEFDKVDTEDKARPRARTTAVIANTEPHFKNDLSVSKTKRGGKKTPKSTKSALTLPAKRPVVVPVSYGKILLGPEIGHTGTTTGLLAGSVVPVSYGKILLGPEIGHTVLGLRNDGEPAYLVSAAKIITIPDVGQMQIWGTPHHLTKGEFAYFPASRTEGHTAYLGSGLYDFMVQFKLNTITIPITYRDADENWYQTDAIIIKDQMARGSQNQESGLRFDFKQRRIPAPAQAEPLTLPEQARQLAHELVRFVNANPRPDTAGMTELSDVAALTGPSVEKIHFGYLAEYKESVEKMLNRIAAEGIYDVGDTEPQVHTAKSLKTTADRLLSLAKKLEEKQKP